MTTLRVIYASFFFVIIFFGSISVGVIVALLPSLLCTVSYYFLLSKNITLTLISLSYSFQYTNISKYGILEAATVVVFAYSAYLIAEGFEVLFIFSLLFFLLIIIFSFLELCPFYFVEWSWQIIWSQI